MPTLYLASHNKHKALDFQAMFDATWTVKPCVEVGPNVQWEETGSTFLENAAIKARSLHEAVFGLGHALDEAVCGVLADDSGLEVSALNGAPGIFSARYAGLGASDQQNLQKLVTTLKGVDNRKARFVCALYFIARDGREFSCEGYCEGQLLHEPIGLKGFGYDPLFIPEGFDKTFAELGDAIKNQLSHRAQALKEFKDFLLTKLN